MPIDAGGQLQYCSSLIIISKRMTSNRKWVDYPPRMRTIQQDDKLLSKALNQEVDFVC